MAPHSSTLAWKIPRTEEPGRLQSMGSLRVGHTWATSLSLFTFMHWRRKWQPIPVFLPGESQGWGSLVGHRLWDRTESDMTEQLHFHFHFQGGQNCKHDKTQWRYQSSVITVPPLPTTDPALAVWEIKELRTVIFRDSFLHENIRTITTFSGTVQAADGWLNHTNF